MSVMELENTASAAVSDFGAAASSLSQGVANLPWGDFRRRAEGLAGELDTLARMVRSSGPGADFSEVLARASVLEQRFIELFRGTQSDFLLTGQRQLNAARQALAAHEQVRISSVARQGESVEAEQAVLEPPAPAPRRVLVTSQRAAAPSRPAGQTVPVAASALADLADAAIRSLTNAEQLEVLYGLSTEQADQVRRRLPRVVSDLRFAVDQVEVAVTRADRERNRDRVVAAVEQLPSPMRQVGDVKALVKRFDDLAARQMSIRPAAQSGQQGRAAGGS